MKTQFWKAAACVLMAANLFAQEPPAKSKTVQAPPGESKITTASSKPDSNEIEELAADVQRLKVLLNQMRGNLAFVQSSQTPLKHQFELEADAWQVLIEQMERRLQRMKDRGAPEKSTN